MSYFYRLRTKIRKMNMKKIVILSVLAVFALTSYAQRVKRAGISKAGVTHVDPTQVPTAVKNAFKVQATAIRWEKQEVKGRAGKSHIRYVAVYKQDGIATRSRFKEDGSTMSSSKYMGAAKLPPVIQSAATAKNPGANLMGAEQFTTKNGQVFYRVRSRNGGSKVTTLYDANGAEVTKDKMIDEIKEGEEENG